MSGFSRTSNIGAAEISPENAGGEGNFQCVEGFDLVGLILIPTGIGEISSPTPGYFL
jgi:hypothetical protein